MKKKLISTLVAFTVACTFTFGTTAQAFAFTDADQGNFDAAVKVASEKADTAVSDTLFADDENYALLTKEEKAQAVADGKAYYDQAVSEAANSYWNANLETAWSDDTKTAVEALAPEKDAIKAAMIKDVMPAAVKNAKAALKAKAEAVKADDYVDAQAVTNAINAAKGVYESDAATLKSLNDADTAFDNAMKAQKTKATATEEAKSVAKEQVATVTHAYKQSSPKPDQDATYEANAAKAKAFIEAQIDAAKDADAVAAISIEGKTIANLTKADIASLVTKLNNVDTLKNYVTEAAATMKAEQEVDENGAFTGATKYREETVDAAVADINKDIEATKVTTTAGIDTALEAVKTRAQEAQDADAQALAAAKKAAKEELDNVDVTALSETDKQAVADIVSEAKSTIDSATDVDAVNTAKEDAVKSIDAVKNLAAAKTAAKEALKGIDKTPYDAEDQEGIQGKIDTANTAIDKAKDTDAVEAAKKTVTDYVANLKTAAQKEADKTAAENLAAAKTAAKEALQGIDKTPYDAGDQAAIASKIGAANTAIDEATTHEAVEAAKKDVTDYVATLKTAAQKDAEKTAAIQAVKDAKKATEDTIAAAVKDRYTAANEATYFAAIDAYDNYLEMSDKEGYEAIDNQDDLATLKAFIRKIINDANAAATAKADAIPSDEQIKLDSVAAAETAIKDAKEAINAYADKYDKYDTYGYVAINVTAKINAANTRIETVKKEIAVVELINALPATVTIADKEAVEEANEAYAALAYNADIDAATKAKLDTANTQLSKSAEEFALEVAQELANLDVTDKDAVIKARADYNALTEEGKKKVAAANVAKLEAAEKTIAEAEATPVIEAITKATSNVTADSRADIEAAKAAYEALDANAKAAVGAKISNPAQTLSDALDTVAKKESEKASAEAKSVEDKINALTAGSTNAEILAAKDAYDALSAAAKAAIDPAAVANLNKAAAKVAVEMIEDDIVTLGDKAVTAGTYAAIAKEVAAIEKRIAELDKNSSIAKQYADKLASIKTKVAAKESAIKKAQGCTSTIALSTKGLKKSVKMTVKVSSANKANKTGFKIYSYNTKTKKYSLVKTVKSSKASTTYKKTKLTKGKKYYYAVKTYKVIDGKTFYGKMSKKVSVKVK